MKQWFFAVTAALFAVCAAAEESVEDMYNRTCSVCHAAGAAGAPVTGSVKDWKARLDKGMDVLVSNVENGMNAMPPKGMCFDCSDADYQALIRYMAEPKQ